MSDSKKLQEALNKIAELANEAINATPHGASGDSDAEESKNIGCSIKALPSRLHSRAAQSAVKINPVNAPGVENMMELGSVIPDNPQFLTLLVSKYWGATPRKLTVSFMESPSAALKKRIVSHMNAWSKTACITFVETTGVGQVRISFTGSGYWSYLGTDILLIPKDRPTMNLQSFSMNTQESEYARVVRHETGHTLGFPHEHMRKELVNRIDKNKAYAYFQRTQGWDKKTVDAQVLTPLVDGTITGTAADQTSIMCYQLPGAITKDGKPIVGGLDINNTDFTFAGKIYPKPGSKIMAEQHSLAPQDDKEDDDWSESEDVQDTEIEEILKSTHVKSNGSEVEA
ncbi:MAG: M12 family metallopeptidase [Chitinophagaceae bacterium]